MTISVSTEITEDSATELRGWILYDGACHFCLCKLPGSARSSISGKRNCSAECASSLIRLATETAGAPSTTNASDRDSAELMQSSNSQSTFGGRGRWLRLRKFQALEDCFVPDIARSRSGVIASTAAAPFHSTEILRIRTRTKGEFENECSLALYKRSSRYDHRIGAHARIP